MKNYAGDYYSLEEFERIEWIDDTSANLIYSTANAAAEALQALTNLELLGGVEIEQISELQLRPAKKLSTNRESELFVRQATTVDVKRKGAYEASRYYLLNPDQDPRERRKQQEHRRPRQRRGSDGYDDYHRRQFDDREHKRRRDDAANGFDAAMYDEDTVNQAGDLIEDRRKRARRNQNEDLFGDRSGRLGGRLRNRSASPLGEGDGRLGFGGDNEDDDYYRARRSRQRSRSPNHFPSRKNVGKELFPSSSSNTAKELFPAKEINLSSASSLDLFPDKALRTPGMRSSMELFPNKRGSFSNHRRSDAVDASRSFQNSTPPPPPSERSLAERISGRPSTAPTDGISVRGVAENGISIRGMGEPSPSVRELFPLKAGNNLGKELFGEKIKGRGGPRRKAEDMFS